MEMKCALIYMASNYLMTNWIVDNDDDRCIYDGNIFVKAHEVEMEVAIK